MLYLVCRGIFLKISLSEILIEEIIKKSNVFHTQSKKITDNIAVNQILLTVLPTHTCATPWKHQINIHRYIGIRRNFKISILGGNFPIVLQYLLLQYFYNHL